MTPSSPEQNNEIGAQVRWDAQREWSRAELEAAEVYHRDRLREAFCRLTANERQLLTCALAGNHPDALSILRPSVIRALAWADLQERCS